MPLDEAHLTQIFIFSASIICMLVVLVLIFVYTYQQRLIQHKLDLQLLIAAQQRTLLEASVTSQEQERARIARDLHDDLGPILSLIKLQWNQLIQTPDAERTAQTEQLLTDAIQNVRRISHDLLPPTLERLGLVAALERLFGQSTVSDGPRLSLTVNGTAYRMEIATELHVYRIVHELIHNSLKHARASHINCVLHFFPHQLELLFFDDGIGLHTQDINQLYDLEGLGWKNINSRLMILAGKLAFLTPVNQKGIHLKITLPTTTLP
ncbi:MAG: histidine kinase [Bacteroidia bacterium]|nr:histidine kinase [Bacteroidia bacterium]